MLWKYLHCSQYRYWIGPENPGNPSMCLYIYYRAIRVSEHVTYHPSHINSTVLVPIQNCSLQPAPASSASGIHSFKQRHSSAIFQNGFGVYLWSGGGHFHRRPPSTYTSYRFKALPVRMIEKVAVWASAASCTSRRWFVALKDGQKRQ